jgi:hypothetical protein
LSSFIGYTVSVGVDFSYRSLHEDAGFSNLLRKFQGQSVIRPTRNVQPKGRLSTSYLVPTR